MQFAMTILDELKTPAFWRNAIATMVGQTILAIIAGTLLFFI